MNVLAKKKKKTEEPRNENSTAWRAKTQRLIHGQEMS